MGPGRVPGLTAAGDHLAALHSITGIDGDVAQVAEERLDVSPVIEDHRDSVAGRLAGVRDLPGSGRLHHRAGTSRDVDAAVELRITRPWRDPTAELRVHRPTERPVRGHGAQE